MTSSNVMASWSPPNPGLPRQSSHSPLTQNPDDSGGFGSMNLEEILREIYPDYDSFSTDNNGGAVGDANVAGGGGARNDRGGGDTTMDEALRDIVSGGGRGGSGEPENLVGGYGMDTVMVTLAPPQNPGGGYGMDTVMVNHVFPPVQFGSAAARANENLGVEFGNLVAAASGEGGGRGKRRSAVEELALYKATQQKQRRMIKNRESSARAWERKQAYTVELESLMTQLEEENARLLREKEEFNKERYKQ